MEDQGLYGYPVKPFAAPKSAMAGMQEAMACQEDHNKWHRDHPGEPCPPEMFAADDYAAVERGVNMLNFGGGGTIEPGDSFAKGK